MDTIKELLAVVFIFGFGILFAWGAGKWKRISRGSVDTPANQATVDRIQGGLSRSEARLSESKRDIVDATVRLESGERRIEEAISLFDQYLDGHKVDRSKVDSSVGPWYSSVSPSNTQVGG